MDPAKWQKIKDLVAAVLELPDSDREAELAREPDEQIRGEASKLVYSHEHAGDFIVKPILIEREDKESPDEYLGKNVENYKILERIGTGGMGAVYLAERLNSDFKQKVALKLIKRGMDSEAILKRFERERRILSSLKHPNIAQLIDGGISSDGLPYFVLEYVEGNPLNQFCRENGITLDERLEIIRQVCAAVEHAHKNLVIHRDLKPSNIIVTEEMVPKLLDFGIAKLLTDDESESTNTANLGRLFTPEYASPEQILGNKVTTATDVYSLGVILYELLTQHRPFDLKGKSYAEVVENVCKTEPTRPSDTYLRNVNTVENSEFTGQVAHNKLRGDLDNIVLKAIRKEPSERYGSVQQLSEDIRRYLSGLPVLARPQTAFYRFGKYFRRHRIGVAAVAFVLISLFTGVSVAIWQAVVATRERARAERQFSETRKLANSMLFEIHDSLSDLPGATSSRELLVARALQYLEALSQDSSDNREVLMELSIAYRKVGDIQGNPFGASTGNAAGAEKSYRASLSIQEKLLAETPDDLNVQKQILTTSMQLANNLFSQGKFIEAKKNFERAITIAKKVIESEPENLSAHNTLAHVYLRMDWLSASVTSDEGAPDFTELAWIATEKALVLNPNDQDALINAANIYSGKGNNLGNPDYNDAGKPSEAVNYLHKSLEFRQKLFKLSPESNKVQNILAVGYRDMGDVLLVLGKVGGSIDYFQKALEIHQSLAQRDPKNAFAQGNVGLDLLKLAGALVKKGDIEEAFKKSGESLSILGAMYSKDESNIMVAHSFAMGLEKQGDVLIAKNQTEEARSYFNRSLVIEKELNSREADFEFELKIAQLHLKIGNAIMRQKPLNAGNREMKAKSVKEFESSVRYYNLAAKRKALGPSNSELLRKAVAALNVRNG